MLTLSPQELSILSQYDIVEGRFFLSMPKDELLKFTQWDGVDVRNKSIVEIILELDQKAHIELFGV